MSPDARVSHERDAHHRGWARYRAARDEHQKAVADLSGSSTDELWAGKHDRARLIAAVVATNGALEAARDQHLRLSAIRAGGAA